MAACTAQIHSDTLMLSGVLDHASVLLVDRQGQQWLQGSAPNECNLDLSMVTYSNSAGIALLLGWLRVAEQQHKALRILNLPSSMVALVNVSGLDEFFGL